MRGKFRNTVIVTNKSSPMLQTLFVMLSLILLSSICGHGQGYEVLDAKRCYYQSGRKIKIGDVLNQKEIVHVKKNGYMTIDVQSPRNLKLSEGWHNIDSLLAVLTVKYDRHISWSNFLKQKGLLGCITVRTNNIQKRAQSQQAI